MDTAVIMDCIVAAILLAFAIYGAWRGLFCAVAGLLILILALAGATFFARELTPKVTELLRPVIQGAVTEKVDSAMAEGATSDGADGETVIPVKPQTEANADESADAAEDEADATLRLQAGELLKLMGWDDTLSQSLADKAEEKVRDTGVSLAMAVVDSMMESFVYMVLFAVALALLSLLLHLAARALDIALKLPGVHLLNGLGGALVGLIQGALAIFLLLWLLRCLHVSFDGEMVTQTHLFGFFATHGPLDLLFY